MKENILFEFELVSNGGKFWEFHQKWVSSILFISYFCFE
jgi:hypothetical protein